MAFNAPKELMKRHPHLGWGDGNNGYFELKRSGIIYRMIASDGLGWEHVSVSLSVNRTPDWDEMCMIKDLFWEEEDAVAQFHPPKKDYVNYHKNCLHLWRQIGQEFLIPPTYLVGPK